MRLKLKKKVNNLSVVYEDKKHFCSKQLKNGTLKKINFKYSSILDIIS